MTAPAGGSGPSGSFTKMLQRAAHGDVQSGAEVLPRVYHELRRIAQRAMTGERDDHTLQATALVHEAWLRLTGGEVLESWETRSHFFRAAAEAMRRILVDHARSRSRLKRGGDRRRLALEDVDLARLGTNPDEILALDEAIRSLAELDPRAAEVVRLRFFAGLDVDETAAVMSVSRRTVLREWAFARAELLRLLADGGDAT